MSSPHAAVAVIGGRGFYEFLDDATDVDVTTPYGDPSAPLAIGTVAGQPVAFLPRHGRRSRPPAAPDQLPREPLGAALRRRAAGAGAVRGRRTAAQRRCRATLVVPDQLVDRTSGRVQTYVERGAVHAPFADPYCAGSRPP